MKKIVIALFILGMSGALYAQKYRTAAGARLGSRFGLTVQQKVFERSTIEGIFQTNLGSADEVMLTVLLEQHQKLIGKRFNFYYGAGFHKGWIVDGEDEKDNPSGISLIAGVEMSIGRLNASLDYKPVLNVFKGERFFLNQSALSLRYILVKPKKKKFNWKFWQKKK